MAKKKDKVETPDVVVVTWTDAWGESGWKPARICFEDHKPLTVTSVGYLLHKDKQGISLTSGLDEHLSPLGQNFIPAKMIKSIKKVK
jgi:hypothetical protein